MAEEEKVRDVWRGMSDYVWSRERAIGCVSWSGRFGRKRSGGDWEECIALGIKGGRPMASPDMMGECR